MLRLPTSQRIGGFTFAIDPMLDCACSVPLWTGAMDPFVLDVCVVADGGLLDLSRVAHRTLCTEHMRHLLLERPAGTIQLDMPNDGHIGAGVPIRPMIDLTRPVEPQFHSARRIAALLKGEPEPIPRETALSRLIAALRVQDALADGASQREIGLGIFGKEWPGDGEHLKSRVRRMIPYASKLVRAGPRAVLAGLI